MSQFENGFVEFPVGVSGRVWRRAGGCWWLQVGDDQWEAVPPFRDYSDEYNRWCDKFLSAA